MGCCGKTTTKVNAKAKHIAVGHINLAGGKKYEFTDDRIRACQECNDNYWIGRRLFCLFRLHRFGRALWPDPDAFVPTLAAVEKNECFLGNWNRNSD